MGQPYGFFVAGVIAYLIASSVLATTSPVGTTAGSFDVNANGAATYTVPLQTPPGINGLEPKLALVYNSQQGNGLLGVGWSLSGLSVVSRCAGNIALDGARSGIEFNSTRFCLDGQRLLPKTDAAGVQETGGDADGTYWEFRTEIDNFARVRAYGSLNDPLKFKIWTKDGRVSSYAVRLRPQSKGTLLWVLDRMEDRKANFLTVSYAVDDLGGEYTPAAIEYGGGGAPLRRVEFITDTTRGDRFTKYLNGAKLFTTRRLNSVTTKVNGLTTRSYNLYYSAEATTAARSLLTSLQECGSDGVCYGKPLTFTARSTGTAAFADGTSVALTLGNEFGQWNQLADINGDGLIDLFRVINAGAGTVVVNLRQSNGSYDGDITTTGVITNETVTGAGFNQWNELADVNGDGIADIFRVIIPGSGGIAEARIHLGNPNGTFQTAALSLPGAVTYGTEGFRFWNQLIDMNGDGLMDVVRISGNTFYISYGYLSNGAYTAASCGSNDASCAFSGLANSNSGQHGFRQTNQFADMNGDGVLDVFRVKSGDFGLDPTNANRGNVLFGKIISDATIPGGKLRYTDSGGDQVGVVTPIIFSKGKYAGYFNYYNQLIDVNGDGILDIARVDEGSPVKEKGPTITKQTKCTRYSADHSTCVEYTTFSYCDTTSFTPCTTYVVTVRTRRLDSTFRVRLGTGGGTYENEVISSGVLGDAPNFNSGSIDEAAFYSDRVDGTSNYTCDAPKTSSTIRQVPNGNGPPANISDTTFEYTCDAPDHEMKKGLTHSNHFADFDGDSYIDILSADANGAVSVAYGKGNGIFNPRVFAGVSVPLDSAKGFRANNQLADLNGDGLVDLFTANGGTGTPKLSQRRVPGLLESVRDGNGSVTSIVYKTLTDASVYTRSTGGDAYPLRKVSVPQNVVAASSVRDGDAAPATFEYTRSYRYADARIDMKRGWLGFAEVTRTDHSAGLETITAFNQSFPYTGRIKQQSVRALSAAAGKYLSKATYGWNNRVNTGVNAAGKVHFVHQTSNTQTRYEPNANYTAALTTTTTYLDNNADGWPYDGYGNPETVQVAHSDGHTLTTVYRNTYAAALYPGQLSAQDTAVTHATPAAGSRTRLTRDIYYGDGLLQDSTSQPDAGNENTELRSKTAYTYDGSGRVLSIAVTGSDPMYDVSGNASHVNVTRQTSFLYSEVGTILTTTKTTAVTGTANHVETLKFDTRHGGLIEAVDPAGIKTARGYDGFARKLSETRYSGSTRPVTTASEYIGVGAAGCPSMTGVVYCVKTTRYGVTSSLAPIYVQLDALERERRSITQDALGSWIYQDTQYDTAGRTWRVSRPYYSGGSLLWTSTSYDLAGRPLQITAPNGTVTTQGYQGLATTVTRTGGLSQSTTTVLDSQNKPIKVVDALNNATNYTYAPFGLLQKITDAKGNAIVNSYDAFGNKTAVTDPDIGTWQFRYNAFGELKWQKDAKAQITSFNYDRRGRLTGRTEGMGTGAVTTAWVYDTIASGAGRLDNVSRADTLRRYTYDTLTGLVSGTTLTVAGAAYGTVTTYDDLGRPASLTYPAGALKVNYTYHVNGALKKISDAASGVGYWEATAYNADGFSTAETWGNGLTGTRGYDAATGALTAITTGGVQRLSYGYYTLGNLQTRRNELHNVTETFYYDLLDRLKRVESNAAGIKNYDYDAIGNITFKSGTGYYSYGARPHAVTQVSNSSANLNGDADNSGSLTAADVAAIRNDILGTQAAPGKPDCNLDIAVNILDILCVNNRVLNQASLSGTNYSYGYDANGNLTSGGGRTLTYTAFNMPLTVDYNGRRESYGYDGDHSRVTKEVRNIATGAVTEKTLYLGKAYERIDRGGAVEERFYISAGDRAVAVVNKSGGATAALYLHTDLLGSVDTVTNAAKTVVDDLSFDAFGLTRKPNWQDGTPATAYTKTTRGYTGHEMDLASGLVNMNARLYDPWLGRFVQADSVIPDVYNPQGINPYSYVLNNPFGYTDPTGHEYIGTFNGVAGFNDGSGSGGMVAAYNTGSGEYSFGDGSRIDAQGNYYAPSSYGSTLYGHTVANWASGAQQANGVGPELARPSTGSSGLPNYGGNHSTVLTGWSSTLPCTYQCHRNGHAETPTYNTGKDISLPLAHATLGVIATGVAALPTWSTRLAVFAYEASTSDGPIVAKGANKAPDFIVSPGGTAFPVPKGATGPTSVINPAGNQTGVAFTGGSGGANGQVSTMRIMNPTSPKGNSPGYPNGYIKYENSASPRPQGVDPYTGKTLPNSQSHFPID